MSLSTYDNSNFKGFYQEKKKKIYIYISALPAIKGWLKPLKWIEVSC